jgi:penicillin-binding protein 2
MKDRGFLILPLLFCLCSCALPLSPSTPTPLLSSPPPAVESIRETSIQFATAWAQGDFSSMYSLLTQRARREASLGAFEQRYRRVSDAIVLQGLQVRSANIDSLSDERAEVLLRSEVETPLFEQLELISRLVLVVEGSGWRVDWNHSAIVDGLEAGQSVRYETWAPRRGNIYLRDDSGAAIQEDLITVGVVPAWIDDEARMLSSLSRLLGMPQDEIRAKYESAADKSWFMPIAKITPDESAVNQDVYAQLEGVRRQPSTMRTYPMGEMLSHVVGYTGPVTAEDLEEWGARGYVADDIVGKTGVELWGETHLAGGRGGRLIVVGEDGSPVSVLKEQKSALSQSIYLTIDPALQAAAYEALGDRRGAVVALDPKTGDLLAMVSRPALDSNDLTRGMSAEQWAELLQDPATPLLNRAAHGAYPPASVFKIVSTSAALQEGAFAPTSLFHCTGSWSGLGDGLNRACWLATGHGTLNLVEGLTQSCDVVYYEVGKALDQRDRDLLPRYAREFGFGAKTGIEGIAEVGGLVPDAVWKDANPDSVSNAFWTTQDAVNLVIGQGYLLATPLQVARMVAAVGNSGTIYRPRLVREIKALGGGARVSNPPQISGGLPVSAENLQAVRTALRSAAMSPQGTAFLAFRGVSVPMAGKTGTAESEREEPHAWFAGYAPADDPRIAIAVVIDFGGEGGVVAAPIFRRVAEAYLASLD